MLNSLLLNWLPLVVCEDKRCRACCSCTLYILLDSTICSALTLRGKWEKLSLCLNFLLKLELPVGFGTLLHAYDSQTLTFPYIIRLVQLNLVGITLYSCSYIAGQHQSPCYSYKGSCHSSLMKDVISMALEDFAIFPLLLIRAPVSVPCIPKW